jgi:PX domain
MKLLLQESDARAASSGNAQGQPLMVTPSNQIQSTSGSTSLIQSPHTDSTISIGLSPPTSKHCSSNADMRLQLPHPHDICDLVIQGAMQVVEDSSPGGVGAGKHTEYAVHVHLYCGLSYSVSRRYNAFLSLDQQLQKLFPGISLPELPSRSLFSTSILDEMDSRCAALNRYVKVIFIFVCVFWTHVFECSGPCARSSCQFLTFAQVFGAKLGAAGSCFNRNFFFTSA